MDDKFHSHGKGRSLRVHVLKLHDISVSATLNSFISILGFGQLELAPLARLVLQEEEEEEEGGRGGGGEEDMEVGENRQPNIETDTWTDEDKG
ncbi:Hypothetical predicted protein [Octopus vulgaris]|uniref:Uncharacterized protein n=1 Tax=Octopus vulgaris TaxID=6645 RepID=A0AA36BKV4_OCTVU|nr:Hypothetical predicted protein [Octopus vulgaris]